ncbi:MAG TPA: hypothetical protein VGK73_39255 [Polyangiaceae bacterium]
MAMLCFVRALAAFWLRNLRLLIACLALSVVAVPASARAEPAVAAEIAAVVRTARVSSAKSLRRIDSARRVEFLRGKNPEGLLVATAARVDVGRAQAVRRRLYLEHCSWLC